MNSMSAHQYMSGIGRFFGFRVPGILAREDVYILKWDGLSSDRCGPAGTKSIRSAT